MATSATSSSTNQTNLRLLSDLLPVPPSTPFRSAFTTSPAVAAANQNIQFVPLDDDKALGVHKVSGRTPPRKAVTPPAACARATLTEAEAVVEAVSEAEAGERTETDEELPPPERAWEALYPAGSVNPAGAVPGGFGFYLAGPPAFSEVLQRLGDGGCAEEAVFGYRVMLEEGWDWVKGGKMPGVYGGDGARAYGCTGGRQEERCKCFNLRPMWRPASTGELYAYLPLTPANAARLAAVPPKSVVNSDYGVSVGRGAYTLRRAVGGWVALAFRVRLNDVYGEGVKENGEIEMWVDGASVIKVGGLRLRESKAGRIGGMHFQTFFGGHTPEWASPKDQRAWFADVTGAVLR